MIPALDELQSTTKAIATLQQHQLELIDYLRGSNRYRWGPVTRATWETIATAMNVTPQAARQRWLRSDRATSDVVPTRCRQDALRILQVVEPALPFAPDPGTTDVARPTAVASATGVAPDVGGEA